LTPIPQALFPVLRRIGIFNRRLLIQRDHQHAA
jgi:hypothetical protein